MLSALYAIARPSVCLSVTQMNQSKTVEVRITLFPPHGSPIPLVFVGVRFIQKFYEVPPSGGIKSGRGGENEAFSSFKRQYLVNGRRYIQS